ncbi:Eukaryotic translation initiation factor 3 subunit A [Camellia lanceoleosa]|nr:Eukaryotic translation initiation factor 3 subunit A [Camellia lanceoleosa]
MPSVRLGTETGSKVVKVAIFTLYSLLLVLGLCRALPLTCIVSQVYQSMKIENLSKMITFFEFSAVEKISVDAVKHNFLAMKVDHMKGVVAFE